MSRRVGVRSTGSAVEPGSLIRLSALGLLALLIEFASLALGPQPHRDGSALGIDVLRLPRIDLECESLIADFLDLIDLIGRVDRSAHRIVASERKYLGPLRCSDCDGAHAAFPSDFGYGAMVNFYAPSKSYRRMPRRINRPRP